MGPNVEDHLEGEVLELFSGRLSAVLLNEVIPESFNVLELLSPVLQTYLVSNM